MNSNWNKLKLKVSSRRSIKRKRVQSEDELFTDRAFVLESFAPEIDAKPVEKKVKPSDTPLSHEETQVVGIDCEFVGCGPGGTRSALARVSVVNFHGEILYDAFVKPKEKVVDYRTQYSGIRADDLRSDKCVPFEKAVKTVSDILEGKVVVGHSLKNDFKALMFSHPRHLIRDTAYHKYFCPFRPKSLKDLSMEHLNRDIQSGEHCSVEDAKAALDLYKLQRKQWESQVAKENRKMKRKVHKETRKF